MLRACRKIAFRMISRSAGNRLRPTIFSAAPPHRSGGAAIRCAARGRPGPQHAIPTWKNVDVPGKHSRNRRSKAVVVTEDPTPGQIPLNSEVNNRRAQVSSVGGRFRVLPVRRWRSKREHSSDSIDLTRFRTTGSSSASSITVCFDSINLSSFSQPPWYPEVCGSSYLSQYSASLAAGVSDPAKATYPSGCTRSAPLAQSKTGFKCSLGLCPPADAPPEVGDGQAGRGSRRWGITGGTCRTK